MLNRQCRPQDRPQDRGLDKREKYVIIGVLLSGNHNTLSVSRQGKAELFP